MEFLADNFQNVNSLTGLSDDCLRIILSFLSLEEFHNFSKLNKEIRRQILQHEEFFFEISFKVEFLQIDFPDHVTNAGTWFGVKLFAEWKTRFQAAFAVFKEMRTVLRQMVTQTIRVKCLKFGEQFTFPQDDLEKPEEMKQIESMIDLIRPYSDR